MSTAPAFHIILTEFMRCVYAILQSPTKSPTSSPTFIFSTCDTVYAYDPVDRGDGVGRTCFADINATDGSYSLGIEDFKKWGWSIGPLGEGTYSFPMYAGASKCVIPGNGQAGVLDVNYSGGTATVTYTATAGNIWRDALQLYVGSEILPRDPPDTGAFTVAPGKYPDQKPACESVVQFEVSNLSGNVYVVAHTSIGTDCGGCEE